MHVSVPFSQSAVGKAVQAQIASLQGQVDKLGGKLASAQTEVDTLQASIVAQLPIPTIAQASALAIPASVQTLSIQVATGVTKNFVRRSGQLAAPAAPALDYRSYISFQSLDGQWWELVKEYDVDSRIFGAKWDFNTDDWQALQMAADYIGTRTGLTNPSGTVYVGGSALVSKTLLFRYNLVGLRGDGQRVSMIRASGDIGDIILVANVSSTNVVSQVSGFSMRNITVRQYYANTTKGAALHMKRAVNANITDVLLYNHFGGLLIEGGSLHSYEGLFIRTGVLWAGAVNGTYMLQTQPGGLPDDNGNPTTWSGGLTPNEIYFSNFSFDADYTPNAVSHIGNCDKGIWYRSGDGVWMTGGHAFGCFNADCWIEPYSATTQTDHLTCTNVWFDNNSLNGLIINGSVTDTSVTPFGDFQFTGCKWLGGSANNYNVWIQTGTNCQAVSFTGCHLDKAGLSNIRIQGVGINYSITGGSIAMAGQQGSGGYGVLMSDSPTDISITGVNFGGAVQGATATQTGGVFLAGGGPDFVTVTGCTFRGGLYSIRDVTTSKHKTYGDPPETETLWQGIIQSSNVLQIQPAGSYFECASSVNNVTDMICRWNKRRVTIKVTSAVTFVHGSGVLQTISGSNVSLTSGQMISFIYTGSYWQQV